MCVGCNVDQFLMSLPSQQSIFVAIQSNICTGGPKLFTIINIINQLVNKSFTLSYRNIAIKVNLHIFCTHWNIILLFRWLLWYFHSLQSCFCTKIDKNVMHIPSDPDYQALFKTIQSVWNFLGNSTLYMLEETLIVTSFISQSALCPHYHWVRPLSYTKSFSGS